MVARYPFFRQVVTIIQTSRIKKYSFSFIGGHVRKYDNLSFCSNETIMSDAFQFRSIARTKCIGSMPCEFTTYQNQPNKFFETKDPEMRITLSGILEQKDTFINYNFSSLLAESGGMMGLFLGWSFLSMIISLISVFPIQRLDSLLTEMLTFILIIGFFIWSKDLFQSYMDESESFEAQIKRVGMELKPPFITVCPLIDDWSQTIAYAQEPLPDTLSQYLSCMRLFETDFFQGLQKCLVWNPDLYSHIFNMDTLIVGQFLPTLTLISDQEVKNLDDSLWNRVFHENYGLCYTLDQKHWKRYIIHIIHTYRCS